MNVTSARRITVINDASEFIDMMQAFLGDELGYEVASLKAVDTTISAVLATRPDLIILDLMLHQTEQALSGWELLVLSRANDDLRNIPVIVASGDIHGILKERQAELVTMAYVHVLPKPFSLDSLEPLVRRLLGEEPVALSSR